MAFGDLRSGGTFTGSAGSITNPFSITGSCAVSVGDLVFAVLGQQTDLTVTAVSDNLGNTYTATNAGTDSGTITGRAFHSRVTNAGTLTSINAATVASSNDVAFAANVFEGPFTTSPLDANPANVEDTATPYTCPATGTLAQADELVVGWAALSIAPATWNATAPHIKGATAGTANTGAIVGYQVVAATTSVSPAYTGSPPTDDVLGTSSFKKDTAAPLTGTASITEANDTAAATGTLPLAGAASLAEENDSLSSTGALALAGAAAVTEAGDALSSTGALALAGASSTTEADDALSAAGTSALAGSAALTEENDALSAEGSGQQITTGQLAAAEEADTLIATGLLPLSGAAAPAEAEDTLSASGVLSVLAIAGEAALQEANDNAAAAGALAIAGALSATEQSDTLAAVGTSVAQRFPTTGRPGGTQISSRPIGRQNINSRRRNEQAASVRRTG